MQKSILVLAVGAIALGLGIWSGLFSDLEGGQLAYLALGGAMIALYTLSIGVEYRGRLGKAVSHALIWLGLCLALVTGYAYRGELSEVAARVTGEIAPPGTVMTVETTADGERAVRLRRRPEGAFYARGEVNGVPATMLVDTGASTVVLKTTDAERAGIDLNALSYTVPVETANGVAYAASIRLKSVAVGPILVPDVEALVARPGSLKESLLGMSFLKRLRSYEFTGDFLTLRG